MPRVLLAWAPQPSGGFKIGLHHPGRGAVAYSREFREGAVALVASGHWEGDLVVGSGGATRPVALVGRSSRLLLCSRLGEHSAETVAARLADMACPLPAAPRGTPTWDQGVEMARWRGFAEAAGLEAHFCGPRGPWQRGANESANGLLRQFFPKGTDFSRVLDEDVARAQDPLNGRPRKTLGRRTPAEELARILTGDGAITE